MKSKIKSVIVFLILVAMLCILCACGSGAQGQNEGDMAGEPETEAIAEMQIAEEWDARILDVLEDGNKGYYPYDYDLSEIQARAEKGDADAQSLMGDIIFFSEGSREAGSAAWKWYEMAADQGDAWSQYMIGRISKNMPMDNEEEVMDYLQQAADQGLICACYELGEIYYDGLVSTGKPVAQDPEKAKELFERAVNGEHLYSQEYRKWMDRTSQTFAKIYLGY